MEISEASQAAHTEAVLAARPKKDLTLYQDGQFLFTELRAMLEFQFDDDVVDEKDERLAAIKAQHEDAPATAATLASKLVDFATLANKHRADLDGVSGFDATSGAFMAVRDPGWVSFVRRGPS